MKLLFATTNAGKLAELIELVAGALEVVSLRDLSPLPEVEEDQATFEGNARKKAQAYAAATGLAALADDSGLCVAALEGRPGVHSARYAENDVARNQKLLAELYGIADRRASFRCALCLALPDGKTRVEEGECRGLIIEVPRGTHGFGYDPLFAVDGTERTLAELTRAEKSKCSHRGEAFRKMRPHLLALADGTF